MLRLSSFALVASLLGMFAGCGDDDDSSGSKAPTGGTEVVCDAEAAAQLCNIYQEPTAVSIQGAKDSCAAIGGKVVDKCPSGSLVGCCLTPGGAGVCYYSDDPAKLKSQCDMNKLVWSTTVPLERSAKGSKGKGGGAFGARPPSPPHAGGEARWKRVGAAGREPFARQRARRERVPTMCLTPRVRGAGGPRPERSRSLPFGPLRRAL